MCSNVSKIDKFNRRYPIFNCFLTVTYAVPCHMLLLLSCETCYSTLPYMLLHMLPLFIRISYWKWNMLPHYCYIFKNTGYILFKIKFAVTCQKFINSTKCTLILLVFDNNVNSNVCSNVSDNITVWLLIAHVYIAHNHGTLQHFTILQ